MGEITNGKGAAIPREPKILIVEDDPTPRLLYQSILRKYGLNADSAENGAVAVSLISRREYDLVISDVAMPEMNGMELLNWIGAFKPHLADKVIILTAAISEDVETHPLGNRFTLLHKLVPMEVFVKTVFEALKKTSAI